MPTVEERLAALEKQMAAWMDQRPTTYYTHQYSGEEIDAAVGRALTGGALDTSVTNVSNQLGTFVRPNLLDNWYFGMPVNQRGQTEYVGNVYTVDRWTTDIDNGGAVLVGSNGITLTEHGMYWSERLSNIADLSGRTMTASVLMSDGSLFCGTVVIAWTLNVPQSFFNNSLIHVYANKIGDDLAQFEIASNAANVSILAAKLELGPTQTLAHQENGVWVLNEVPDYGEQLRRCQRYFWRLHSVAKNNYAIFAYGMKQSADQVRFVINFPVTFRVTPVITANGKFLVSDGTTDYAMDSTDKQSFNGESIVLTAKSSKISALPNGTCMRFSAFDDAGAYIDFSADL